MTDQLEGPTISSSNSNKNHQDNSPCQECQGNAALYQCPRCSWKTCSLQCCRRHKERTRCNGKRDKTAYLPLYQMDDQTISSDYHFLEDIIGNVDAGKRLLRSINAHHHQQPLHNNHPYQKQKRQRLSETESHETIHPILLAAQSKPSLLTLVDTAGGASNNQHGTKHPPHPQLPPKQRQLAHQAKIRGVTLLFMPIGMERHRTNQSQFLFHKHVISWTVEWCFYDPHSQRHGDTPRDKNNNSMQYETHTCQVLETTLISQALRDVWKRMKKGCALQDENYDENISILLPQLPCPSNRMRYVEISKAVTLAEALRGGTIIEYPVLHVVPKEIDVQFPRFLQEIHDNNRNNNNSNVPSQPRPETADTEAVETKVALSEA